MRRFTAVRAAIAIVSIFGIGMVLPDIAAATPSTLYVAGSGGVDAGAASDSGNCLTEGTPCATIAYALGQASSGDTIDISGTLSESASTNVSQSITLAANPDGSGATIAGNGSDTTGLIDITGSDTVVIDGLTLEDGYNTGSGGAITNDAGADLTVIDSTLSQNQAIGDGGAIDNNGGSTPGSVTITDSTLSENGTHNDGGAVDNSDGDGLGGSSGHGTVTISGSTLSDNFAANNGGGIDNNDNYGSDGVITVTDSTFTGNYGGYDAGAIDNNDDVGSGGSVTVVDSTLAGDYAPDDGEEIDTDDFGGSGGPEYLAGDLIAGSCDNDADGAPWITDAGYNAAIDSSCLGANVASTDAIGANAGELGSLADNGGPTQTIMPTEGNPALRLIPDGAGVTTGPGNSTTVACPSTDQRGVRSAPGQACDAGAIQRTQSTTYASGSGGDDVNAASDDNDCSDPSTPCATVQGALDQLAPGGTVELSGTFSQSQGINVDESATFETKPGDSGATIDGNAQDTSGLMNVVFTGGTVTVQGLTLENGYNTAPYGGGAITHNVGGQLNVIDSTISASTAENGGAIDNNDATSGAFLTITGSTLTGNSAPDGGAIDNNDNSADGGTVTISDSTISGNAAADGGAIDSSDNNGTNGSVTITNSTLAGDSAFQLGEEIGNSHYGTSGSVYLGADVIAGTCANDGDPAWWTDAGYNAATDSSCLGASPAGTDAAVAANAGDLGPLQNNGGATETQALAADSAAVGLLPLGTSFTTGPGSTVTVSCPVSSDQRGIASAAGSACDTGAVQYAEQTLSVGSGTPSTVVVGQAGVSVSASSTSGLTVAFSRDAATTNGACTLSGGAIVFAHTGTCVIDAEQSGNQNFAPASSISRTITVNPSATTTSTSFAGGTLTAAVSAVAPGGGTPIGTVEFQAAGQLIGTADLSGGHAQLPYAAPANTSQQVTARYVGSDDYTASSSSALSVAGTASTPVITAKLSSRRTRSRTGWWTAAVKITFTCRTGGATLTTSCPAPVMLARSGVHQRVHRMITTTAGHTAAINITGINIDLHAPSVRIAGPNPHRTYALSAPAAHCKASDRVSGIRSCRLSRQWTATAGGYELRYAARATSGAGMTSTRRVAIRVSSISLRGATWKGTATYAVSPGRDYVLEVLSKIRPTYLNAAPDPRKPGAAHQYFTRRGSVDGLPLWSTPVRVTRGFARFPAWTVGVQMGGRTYRLRLLT